MWFVVSKKQHREVLDEWGHAEHEWREEAGQMGREIEDRDAILHSAERHKVLTDLQAALNLIRSYQRSLSTVGAADPQISQANSLLESYGMKGDPSASYLGFKRVGDFKEPLSATDKPVDLDSLVTTEPVRFSPKWWKQEEEKWGEEAYGEGTVRVEGVAVDEGDEKEPGYTRARIQFVDLNDTEEEPEELQIATG